MRNNKWYILISSRTNLANCLRTHVQSLGKWWELRGTGWGSAQYIVCKGSPIGAFPFKLRPNCLPIIYVFTVSDTMLILCSSLKVGTVPFFLCKRWVNDKAATEDLKKESILFCRKCIVCCCIHAQSACFLCYNCKLCLFGTSVILLIVGLNVS